MLGGLGLGLGVVGARALEGLLQGYSKRYYQGAIMYHKKGYYLGLGGSGI